MNTIPDILTLSYSPIDINTPDDLNNISAELPPVLSTLRTKCAKTMGFYNCYETPHPHGANIQISKIRDLGAPGSREVRIGGFDGQMKRRVFVALGVKLAKSGLIFDPLGEEG